MTTAELLDEKYDFLTGDVSPWEHGGTYVTPVVTYDGARAHPLIEIGCFDLDYFAETAKVFVIVTIVCPDIARESGAVDDALKSRGWTMADIPAGEEGERWIIEALHTYGAAMVVNQRVETTSDDLDEDLLRELEQWAIGIVDSLDNNTVNEIAESPQNAIMASGRDFMSGNPLGQFAR